jgi:hypothetical protein
VDPAIANIVAYNAADSVDTIVQTELRSGTNVIQRKAGTVSYVTNGTVSTPVGTTMTATDTFNSPHRPPGHGQAACQQGRPPQGGLYWCAIHPEVSHDLRCGDRRRCLARPAQLLGRRQHLGR